MRRKILAALAAAALTLSLCGCAEVESVSKEEKITSMFCLVENTQTWRVVYHKKTKVMYAVSVGAYNCGNFTLLVNADGTPMLYEDGQE